MSVAVRGYREAARLLREARATRGWSLVRLTARVNALLGPDRAVSPTTIHNIETGRTHRPNREILTAICQALRMSPEETVEIFVLYDMQPPEGLSGERRTLPSTVALPDWVAEELRGLSSFEWEALIACLPAIRQLARAIRRQETAAETGEGTDS